MKKKERITNERRYVFMERLRLWLSLTQDEKFAAAEKELKDTIVARYEFADEWSRSIEDIAPGALAETVIQTVEALLGLQWRLEWDYDADADDMELDSGATTYWFKVSDPETGYILTHKTSGMTGERLRYFKLIETFRDAVQAVVDLADIIAEKLPVLRSQVSLIKEVK
jgi:hypothetical protein